MHLISYVLEWNVVLLCIVLKYHYVSGVCAVAKILWPCGRNNVTATPILNRSYAYVSVVIYDAPDSHTVVHKNNNNANYTSTGERVNKPQNYTLRIL